MRSLHELIAIRYIQVPNEESPRKERAWRNAEMNASWVASNASARSPSMRTASAKIRSSWRWTRELNARSEPSRNLLSSSSSRTAGSSATSELDLRYARRTRIWLGEPGYPQDPVPAGHDLVELERLVGGHAVDAH